MTSQRLIGNDQAYRYCLRENNTVSISWNVLTSESDPNSDISVRKMNLNKPEQSCGSGLMDLLGYLNFGILIPGFQYYHTKIKH